MGSRLYIDCKSVIYGSMCIYTVTKAEVGSLRCGVDVTTCLTYLNENLSLCEIHHYIRWVYVNMNFKKEVKQNQSSFHSSCRFWSIAFPKSFVRTLFCLLTRLICSCSHESPSHFSQRCFILHLESPAVLRVFQLASGASCPDSSNGILSFSIPSNHSWLPGVKSGPGEPWQVGL